MQQSNVATITQEPGQLREVHEPSTSTANMLMNPQVMEQLHAFAVTMAKGNVTVPNHLKGNQADCLAIAMQSAQWGMNPFAVAQKTHLVQGTLGYEAQLVNAVVSSSSAIVGRFKYKWFGPWENVIGKFIEKTSLKGNKYTAPNWTLSDEKGLGITVSALLKGDQEPVELTLLLSQAQVRNSTLWASDPKQQLAYLAVKRWARLYCPDVILGVYTADELEPESQSKERELNPAPTVASSSLTAKLAEPSTQEPANNSMPNFDEGPGYTPVSELLEYLPACTTKQDLDDWKAQALAWPEASNEYAQLVTAYNAHCKELKSKALQEASS